jgi:hypothetical protein
LAILAVLLTPASLYAQGCAMCYQTAANSGSQFIRALRHGILIMLFPPLVIMGGILYMAYHKRNLFNKEAGRSRRDFYETSEGWELTD